MKNIAFALCSLICIATSAHATLPAEVEKLQGRPGTLMSSNNGVVFESESNIDCTIGENRWSEGAVVLNAATFFTTTAGLKDASKKVKGDTVIFTTTSNGRRIGGSVCGDMMPLTSYKQTVIVDSNSLTVREKFTCAIFEKNDIVITCTLK